MALAVVLSVGLGAAESPVADAAARGDREAVKSLLKQAADVNAAQGDGMTALHWAAMNGDVELAQMLIFAGANVRATTRLGTYTPLYLASQQGHGKVIQALVKAGGDVKAGTPNGTTPLMVAAASGEVEAVRALIEGGADVNAKDGVRGADAADVRGGLESRRGDRAARVEGRRSQGHQQGVGSRQPVARRRGLWRQSAGPRRRCARAGRSRAAAGAAAGAPRRAPMPGVDRNYQLNELIVAQGGLTPLLYAVRQGYQESTDALLKAGADINQLSAGDKTTPLMMAIINGHFDLAKSLLEKGANPNTPAPTASRRSTAC